MDDVELSIWALRFVGPLCVLFFCVLFSRKKYRASLKTAIHLEKWVTPSTGILIAGPLFIWFFTEHALKLINKFCDTSSPNSKLISVVKKRLETRGKNLHSNYLVCPSSLSCFEISKSTWDQVKQGGEVCIVTRSGRLGFEWLERDYPILDEETKKRCSQLQSLPMRSQSAFPLER